MVVCGYAAGFWNVLIARPMRSGGQGNCDFCGRQVVKKLHLRVASYGTPPCPGNLKAKV